MDNAQSCIISQCESQGSSQSLTISQFSTYDTQVTSVESPGMPQVFFFGVSESSSFTEYFTGEKMSRVFNLLIKAVNNRTIERDYFKLYCEMLMGNISEEQFEKELDDNESAYVVDCEETPSVQDLKLAVHLSNYIKDVKTSEDLSSLFSFNVNKIEKLLSE